MAQIKVSDYIAKRLKERWRITNVFMVSGGGAMHLNDSFGKYISYIANHHEQACAIAAEGYARVEQKLAVVNITTGPGGLNCLNGVFGQWTDSVPVLYISGQVKTSTCLSSCPDLSLRQLGDQEVDIISVVKPLVKYAKMITDANEIKYHLDKAVITATTGRFGPVWLDIPINIQAATVEENDLIEFIPPKEEKTEKQTFDLSKFETASRPLIIAGHGIRLSGQIGNFKEFIKNTNIPVVTTFNSMDIFNSNDKNFIGRIGTVGQRAGNYALQNADVILCLGTRNNIRQVSYNWENFAQNAYKIVVDIDSAELDKPLVKPDLKINADLKDFIPELKNINTEFNPKWMKFCKKIQKKYSFEKVSEYQSKKEINVYDFVHTLTECLQDNTILTAANGSACVCLHQVGVVKDNQRIIFNSGNASMGYDLPSAIGASVYSKSTVICLAGDGSVMMNLQELQTIIHNNLPIKIFIINNNGYSSIRQTQRNFFEGRMTGCGTDSGVSVPDFCKVAEAFGFNTVRIKEPKQMRELIIQVLNSKEPVLCEVITEKEYIFQPKLSSRINPDGTMTSPALDDMYPFVEKEVYTEN